MFTKLVMELMIPVTGLKTKNNNSSPISSSGV